MKFIHKIILSTFLLPLTATVATDELIAAFDEVERALTLKASALKSEEQIEFNQYALRQGCEMIRRLDIDITLALLNSNNAVSGNEGGANVQNPEPEPKPTDR